MKRKFAAKRQKINGGGFSKLLALVIAFTMAASVIPIAATAEESKVELGPAVSVYNLLKNNKDGATYTAEEVGNLTDDVNAGTSLTFWRNVNQEHTYVSAVVYDAGEENTFDFNHVRIVSNCNVDIYGTDEQTHSYKDKTYDILNISGTADKNEDGNDFADYSENMETFAEEYGLTHVCTIKNKLESLNEPQSFRYIVVIFIDTWGPEAVVTDISLFGNKQDVVLKREYKIINVGNGLAFVTRGAGTGNGTQVISWTDNNAQGRNDLSQLWYVEKDDEYFSIKNLTAGRYADMINYSKDSGGNVIIYDHGDGTNQDWLIVPVKKIGNDTCYKIINRGSGLALSLMKDTREELVTQQEYTGADGQLWKFDVVTEGLNDIELPTEFPVRDSLDKLAERAEIIFDLSNDGVPSKDEDLAVYAPGWTVGTDNDTALNRHGVNLRRYVLQDDSLPDAKYTRVLQFWSEKTLENVRFYAQKEKQDTIADVDKHGYYIYEFYPSVGQENNDSDEMTSPRLWNGSIGLFDDMHNFIASVGYQVDEGTHEMTVDPGLTNGKFDAPKSTTQTETFSNGAVARKEMVRLVVENNEGEHSAAWYHRNNELEAWKKFYEATYEGNVYGLGKIEAYRVESDEYSHIGLGDLKVYAGDKGKVLLDPIYTRVGFQPQLPATYLDQEITWDTLDVSKEADITLTGQVTVDGEELNVEMLVHVKPLDYFLTNYYDFNEETPTDKKGSTTAELVNAEIRDGKLLIPTGDNASHLKITGSLVQADQTEATISAWVYRTSMTTPNKGVGGAKNRDGRPAMFGFGNGTNGRSFFSPEWDGTGYGLELGGNGRSFVGNTGAMGMNGWHYLVVTVDESGRAIIYDNGEKKTQGNVNGGFNSLKGSDNYVGWSGYGNLCALAGYYDDFKVYNVELTDREIKKIYDDEVGNYSGLVTVTDGPTLSAKEDVELILEYTVDFSQAIGANTLDNVTYAVEVERIESTDGGMTTAQSETIGTEELGENGTVKVGFAPDNSNRPYRITAKASYDNNVIASVTSETTTLYEEVIKDLASGVYATAEIGQLAESRLAKVNEVIGKGGLMSLTSDEDLDDTRQKIMEKNGNTVSILEPFKKLGIGFLYKEGSDGIYVGSESATGDIGTVYQSITLGDGTITLGDPVNTQAADVVLTLETVEIEYVRDFFESFDDDFAAAEQDFTPEL